MFRKVKQSVTCLWETLRNSKVYEVHVNILALWLLTNVLYVLPPWNKACTISTKSCKTYRFFASWIVSDINQWSTFGRKCWMTDCETLLHKTFYNQKLSCSKTKSSQGLKYKFSMKLNDVYQAMQKKEERNEWQKWSCEWVGTILIEQ